MRVLRERFNWKYAAAIGITFAAGMLIKPTLSGFAPLVALVVFMIYGAAKGGAGRWWWRPF
ncbi:MAG: hypothetical protein M5U34_49265 [Chloroflexi bacterium]|nr:hypothetical protein [Chloroflexota bacterium]